MDSDQLQRMRQSPETWCRSQDPPPTPPCAAAAPPCAGAAPPCQEAPLPKDYSSLYYNKLLLSTEKGEMHAFPMKERENQGVGLLI